MVWLLYYHNKIKDMKLIILFFLLFSGGIFSKLSADAPFEKGEKLLYEISYSMYFNFTVGEVSFELMEQPRSIGDREYYHVVSEGRTYRFYDNFFKVRDYHESFFDTETLLPRIFIRDIYEGGYEAFDYVVFDHSEESASIDNEKNIDITQNTHDILSVLYYFRSLDFDNMNKGDSIMVDTYVSGEVYEVGAVFEGREEIKTKKGTFRTLKIRPILIAGRVFESEEDMMLYVTDDKNRIPVKIKSGISVGSITAELSSVENLNFPLVSRID